MTNQKFTEDIPNTRPYRFWPVYTIAFIRTFFLAMYNRAFPNYMLYNLDFSPSLTGIIVSVFPFAYMLSPLISKRITDRIGIRYAIGLSILTTILSMFIQIFVFIPWVLVIIRAIEGVMLGLFWPNLQMQISLWQAVSNPEACANYFKRYGNAWNSGLLFGYVLGFLLVFKIGDNFLVIIISAIFAISMLIPWFFYEQPTQKLIFHNHLPVVILNQTTNFEFENNCFTEKDNGLFQNDSDSHEISTTNREKVDENKPKFDLSQFPTWFFLTASLYMALIKSFYNFYYPVFLEHNNQDSSIVYITIFFQQAFQLIILSKISVKHKKIQLRLFLSGLIGSIVISLMNFFTLSFIGITVSTILLGLLYAWMYAFPTQIMWNKGSKHNTSSYAIYYEAFVGLGSTLGPFIGGYLVEWSINGVFFIIAILVFVITIVFYQKSQNLQKML